jgi:hypothetical protein
MRILKHRLHPLLVSHWLREDLLLRFGAGNVLFSALLITARFIGGASCMCIAISVAELVSAYPVCHPLTVI